MPDFSALLQKPAGEAKRPPTLPVGDYHATVSGHAYDDENRNRTPYVRFTLTLTEWPDDMASEDQLEGVDLSKRQLRKDFYLTEDSLWRLDAFIRSCGVDPEGRPYDEVIPTLIGQPVVVQVKHYTNQRSQELGNTAGDVVGQYGKQ